MGGAHRVGRKAPREILLINIHEECAFSATFVSRTRKQRQRLRKAPRLLDELSLKIYSLLTVLIPSQ